MLNKDFYYYIYPNSGIIPIVSTGLVVADDGSIFVAGRKNDNQTWLLKLNCVGEVIPEIPISLCEIAGGFYALPKVWIRQLSLNNASQISNDSFSPHEWTSRAQFNTPLTRLQRGQNYPLSIIAKTAAMHSLDSVKAAIWLDFNRNGQIKHYY